MDEGRNAVLSEPTLWFLVPAQGRFALTRVCLRQLVRTCEALGEEGVIASAMVAADDANLDTALECGFGTVERENRPLGRKWNDLYEAAGRAGVDYVMPFGSDDWVDPSLVLAQFEASGDLRCSRLSSVVSEDGQRLAPLRIEYEGGDGVRMLATAALRPLGYRPAEEDRERAIDTSVMRQLWNLRGGRPRISYTDLHPLQIVDFKSSTDQLNDYERCRSHQHGDELDPWDALASHYPAEALAEMRVLHGIRESVAA